MATIGHHCEDKRKSDKISCTVVKNPDDRQSTQYASSIQPDSSKMSEETPVQNTVVEEVVPEATTVQETTTNAAEPVSEEVTPKAEAVEESPSQEVVPEVTNAIQDAAVEAPSAETATAAEESTPTMQSFVPPAVVTQEKHSDGLPQYLHDAVYKMAPQEGFTPGQFQVRFEVGSGKGDGFVAEMFRAHITEGARELVVLCKIPPINDVRRLQFGSMAVFEREVLAYSKLLPTIYEFQREKGVTEESGLGFFNAPKCYMTHFDEAKQESVIIMDDLRLKDYRMWNKQVPVNYEHTKLALEQLGRLHAVSFALKDQRPEVFEQFKVHDPMSAMLTQTQGFAQMMQMQLDRALSVLEVHEENARQKLLKLRETMMDDISTITRSEFGEPYSILGHGDCWVNNFIFSYKRGVPSEIILLDWQICRYVSPALDLLYFMFSCTDEDLRRKHYDEMIGIYYASFKQLLEKLGGDPQGQFPFTALLRQLKTCGRFGMLMAIFMVPMMCIDNQDLPDMDEAAEKFKETLKVEEMPFTISESAELRYRKRMGGVIRDMIRYGYL